MTATTTARPESAGISWPSVLWIFGIHAAALLAFVPAYFSWSALAVCVVLHWLTGGIGICLTYHRLLTHRSFATRPKALEYLLTAFGCCASEGGAIGWVADHRKHHAFSDEDEDVHSPKRGFGWAHMVWWMVPDVAALHTPEYYRRWAPDLYRDPIHRFMDRYFILFPLALFAALYAIGGMPWLVWGGFVRTVAVLHCTWLINSATHIWGYRTFKTRDTSKNLLWVALVTYGEGWHNNHHAFQTSARHGNRWFEPDPTYWTIKLMTMLGIFHTVKMPKMVQSELNGPGAAPAPTSKAAKRREEDEELVTVGE